MRTRALRCIGLLRRSSGNITQIEGYPQTSCGIVFERNISPFPKPNDMPEACTRSISRGTYLDAFRAWLISAIDNLSAISEPRTPGCRVYMCVHMCSHKDARTMLGCKPIRKRASGSGRWVGGRFSSRKSRAAVQTVRQENRSKIDTRARGIRIVRVVKQS